MATRNTTFKMPRKIKICGQVWTLKTVSGLKHPEIDSEILGLCEYDKRTIILEKNQSRESFKETFLHEYMHAVWHISGIYYEGIPTWVEHVIIKALENDMLGNNKTLFRRLFS